VFFLLSKTIDVLLSPLVWSLVLLATGVLLSESGRRKTARRVCFGAGLGILVLMSTRSAERILLTAAERSAVDRQRPGVTYDAVVVLGGLVREPGPKGRAELSEGVDRLTAAFGVLSRGEARYAILAGGAVQDNLGEAAAMRDLLVGWGIARERLIVDDTSLNTRDNAAISKKIVEQRGFRSVLLITSAFHMLRSEECFRAVGLEVDTLPVDYLAPTRHGLLPRAEHLRGSELAIREFAGRVIYRVMGYSRPGAAG
jgi:uncharacterized SAM-binding protein YcdF (DUF218 family)